MRIHRFFQCPGRVFIVCTGFLLLTLVGQGSLWRLWNLHREYARIQQDILVTQDKTKKLDLEIQKIKDPNYLEREARERLDLVSENDLVFIFPSE